MLKNSTTFWRDLVKTGDFDFELRNKEITACFIMNYAKGKGTVFLRKETIPEYRAKAEFFRKKSELLRRKIHQLEIEVRKAERVKLADVRKSFSIVKRQARGIRAREKHRLQQNGGQKYLNMKMRGKIFSSTAVMEGAISFPIIYQFIKKHKNIDYDNFCMLMFFFCFKYITFNDYAMFGFSRETFRSRIITLYRKGYLDKSRIGKLSMYFINFRGDNLMKEYQEEYERVSKMMVKNIYEKKEDIGDFVEVHKIRKSAKKLIDEETRTKNFE